MSITAVAIDLDGTLLTTDKLIGKYTLDVLHQLMEQHISIHIATGRSVASSERFREMIETTDPMVCYNGGVIWDPVAKKDLYHVRIDEEICEELVRISYNTKSFFHAYKDHDLYFDERARYADRVERLSSLVGKSVNFQKQTFYGFSKAVFIGEPSETQKIKEYLQERFGNNIRMLYPFDDYLEIMSYDATKGDALRYLATLTNKEAHNFAAFGDELNDVEMLKWAGKSYGMKNGHPEAIIHAKEIIGTNDNDAVGKTLARLFSLSV
ncbi:MAG: Cof-type HAD-IIB family hydrolase [Sphaerochaetaceae bacterium]|jgi:Cof subfamily protein (haloacid dehalogenase superfamily)